MKADAHLDRMTGRKRGPGRPRLQDKRERLTCKIPPEQLAALRLLLVERINAGERPEDAKRPLDYGDLIADALAPYLARRKGRK